MAVEAALIKRIGEPGEKLHTARSRNDQVATDIRLWMRDEIATLQGAIARLQKALVSPGGRAYRGSDAGLHAHAAGAAHRHRGLPAELRAAA